MGRIIEGLWDCKYCGKTEIGGSQKKCPVCGKQRDENIKFYLKGEKKYISDEEAKKVSKNPDWLCPYCSNLNSDNDNKCSYCGASRDGTEKDYFENRAEKDKEENLEPIEHRLKDIYGTDFSDEDELEDEEQSADDYYNDYHNKRESKKSKSLSVNWGILGFSSIFIVMIGLLIAFLIPKNADLVIQDFSWERNISIERYQTVNESDWSLPSGARLQRTNQEFSHYQQVLDHYETKTREVAKERLSHYDTVVTGTRDMGNGYFEEITQDVPVYETYYETETYEEPVYKDVPIYRTKYYYEIDKWLHERDVKTSGNDKDRYWGEVVLADDERESGRRENLSVTAKNEKDKVKKYHVDENIWNQLEKGESVTVKVSGNSIIEILESSKKITKNIIPLYSKYATEFC